MKNNLTKKLAILLTVVMTAILMICCNGSVSVSLNESAVTMVVGDTSTIVATVTGSEETATWTTSNAEVVTVQAGELTAVAPGTATVTAKVGDKSASAEITVISREAIPTLLLNMEELSVKEGGNFTLVGVCSSLGQTVESTLTFESSDTSIATVNENGVVSGVSKGECTITVSGTAMGIAVSATCEVTVVPDIEIRIADEAIDLTLIELVEEDATSYTANAKVWINGAETQTAINYESDDQEVFTVTSGVLTPVAEGEANLVITATVEQETITKIIPVTVQRTLCQNYEISMVSEQRGMLLTKEVEGYKTGFDLEIEVAPYSDDMIIEWATTSNIIEIVPSADKRAVSVVAKAGAVGGEATVTVTIERNVTTTQTFNVEVYVPISTEEDFYRINDNKVEGFNSFVPIPGSTGEVVADIKTQCDGIIPGYYILTNDIVLQNTDPSNTGTAETGLTYYKKAIVGRSTTWADLGYAFAGLFDGNGYKISGARFDINGSYQAIFGANNGTIKNLEVELSPWAWSAAFPTYTLRKISAAIASFNVGTIENCKVVTELNVDNGGGSSYTAGITYSNGFWQSQIKNCFVEVKATRCYSQTIDAFNVGAFVGTWDNGTLSNVYGLASGMTGNVVEIVNVRNNVGTRENYAVKTTLADLKTAGFDAENYDSDVWSFVESGDTISASLKNGCTLASVGLTPVVSVEESVVELVQGKTAQIVPSTKNGTNEVVAVSYGYSVTPANIVSVDAYGKITALNQGEATVTVTAYAADKTATTTVTVTVVAPSYTLTATSATSATILTREVSGYNHTAELEIEVEGWETGMVISWASSDATIATVTANADSRSAVVTPASGSLGGPVTITASTEGAVTPVTFTINTWVPISNEADLYGINANTVEKSAYKNVIGTNYATLWGDINSYCTNLIQGYYLMTDDITLTNSDPDNTETQNGMNYYKSAIVGRSTAWNVHGSGFNGVFDGNGYKISGAKFNINANYQALFGANTGIIRNVEMVMEPWAWTTADFPGYCVRKNSGVICAFNVGVIENCYTKTDINADNGGSYSSALVYQTSYWASSVKNCFVDMNVTRCLANQTGEVADVGAFVGMWDNGSLANCWGIKTGLTAQVKDIVNNRTSAGTMTNYGTATDLDSLKTAGFDASQYDSTVWSFVENEGALTVSLKDGCTLAKVTA